MTDITKLISKRVVLEELLNRLNPSQKDIELKAYDLMINSKRNYENNLNEELEQILLLIKEIRESELENLSAEFKMESELLSLVSKYGHAPAYIFLLNFDPNNPEHKEHIFRGNYRRECIGKHISDPSIIPEIEKIAYEDNAILVKPTGVIHATNVQLVDVDPIEIYEKNQIIQKAKTIDYNKLYGFAEPVHTRHYVSMGASSHLPDTAVYTLGEKGNIRRFQKGIITFSTIDEEQEIANQRIEGVFKVVLQKNTE